MSGAKFARAVEALAHDIAGDTTDQVTLGLAREAAERMLELDRARRIEVALIERALTFGRLDPAKVFASKRDEVAWIMQHYCGATLWKGRPKYAEDTLPPLPAEEPHRTAEGVRRALPSLLKLRRYQARAVAKRDQAIRKLLTIPAERTQFRLE